MNSPIGIPYAKFDPSISRMRIAQPRQPSWFGAYVWCLKRGDYEAAAIIRGRNTNGAQ